MCLAEIYRWVRMILLEIVCIGHLSLPARLLPRCCCVPSTCGIMWNSGTGLIFGARCPGAPHTDANSVSFGSGSLRFEPFICPCPRALREHAGRVVVTRSSRNQSAARLFGGSGHPLRRPHVHTCSNINSRAMKGSCILLPCLLLCINRRTPGDSLYRYDLS